MSRSRSSSSDATTEDLGAGSAREYLGAGSAREDFIVGFRIARAEVLDLWRRNDSRRQRAIYALLALLILPGVVIFVQQGYNLGVSSRDGVTFPVVEGARNLLLPGMIIGSILGGIGAVQSFARDSVRPLLLTSASTRAIVVGNVLYLLGTWLVPLSFMFVVAVAYAVGAQTPLFPVALALALLPVLLLTLLVGLTLAYLLWLGIERLGLPEQVRKLLTAVLSLVVFVFAFAGGFLSGQVTGDPGDQIPTGDPLTPVGWYADLLFVGSPVAESPGIRTAVAAVLVLGLIPLVFAAQVRIAPAFWYATPSDTGDDEKAADSRGRPDFDVAPSERLGRTRGLTARSQTLRIAAGYVKSARRRPDQYVYLFYYLFPVLAVVVPLSFEGQRALGPAIGLSLVVLGIWLAGAIFCLNPLGTEGAMLSQLVLADTSARTFVHARLLAGIGTGFVLVVAGLSVFGATAGGILGPLEPLFAPQLVVLVSGFLLALVVLSSSFALGIGSALPKFETIEVFDSIETLAPSVVAALVHGGLTLFLMVFSIAVAFLAGSPESPLSTPARLGTLALFAAFLVVLADGSRRYAITRLGGYGRDGHRPDRLFVVYAAVALAALSFAIGQSLGLSVAFLAGQNWSLEVLLPVLFVIEYLGYVLVGVGFLYATQRGVAYLDLDAPSVRDAGIVVAGVLVSLAVWAAGLVVISGLGLPAADHTLFRAEEADPRLLLALVPLLLFVNGPVEELLYRNVIQKYLQESFSTTIAVVLASLIFALVHVPAYLTADLLAIAVTLGLLFVLSCLWGYIYARTGSLFVVAAIHGLYNAILVAGVYVQLA